MRERFRLEGLEGFAPHEVLELLLFYARARGNVNPLAHRLLDVFGSLKGVLEAPPEQLMAVEGVGEETATLLGMMVPLFRRYEACVCQETKQLLHYSAVADYCRAMMAGLRKERFCVISLSAKMKVLGQRVIAEGDLSEVAAYPRLVVETVLNHNAHSVILCHNHPGGEVKPSPMDVEVTQRLQTVLAALNIRLMDHLIYSDGKVYSMAACGDFQADYGAGNTTLRSDEEPPPERWP